jgi:hypothetical protein
MSDYMIWSYSENGQDDGEHTRFCVEDTNHNDCVTVKEAMEAAGFDTFYWRQFPNFWNNGQTTRYQAVGYDSEDPSDRIYMKSVGSWHLLGFGPDEAGQVSMYTDTPYTDESPFKGIRPYF